MASIFSSLLKRSTPEALRFPPDFDALHRSIYTKVKPYTMTSAERIYGLIEAVRYITKYKIEGSIVECGVWKGGSMMAVAETLNALQDRTRELYLYDTFAGMPPPTEEDKDSKDVAAAKHLRKEEGNKESSLVWAYSSLPDVQDAMRLTHYDATRIHYIEGKVEDTLPGTAPEKIALLRLDTDWYESTKHELEHLFSRLSRNGVLIIDDYGFWKGSRKAVDEFFDKLNTPVLLTRMDDTGRICVKTF